MAERHQPLDDHGLAASQSWLSRHILSSLRSFLPCFYHCLHCMGFPGGSAGKESTCNEGDLGSFPGLGRSLGEGKGYPLQVFWPGEFRGLYIYSPWGHKESDTTEQLSLHCVVLSQQRFCSVSLDDPRAFLLSGENCLEIHQFPIVWCFICMS